MTSYSQSVDQLIEMMVSFGPGNDVVANPWVDEVPGLDASGAPKIRQANLRAYLLAHQHARWIFVGQEAGYAGCRFSGIAFTGENMLVAPKIPAVLAKHPVAPSSSFEKRISERSANIVWPVIGEDGKVVLWNSFPFHCHEANKPLTNRAWNARDDRNGLAERILRHVLDRLFPTAQRVAVGRKAFETMAKFGYDSTLVRHPSQGGAPQFRQQVGELLGNKPQR